MTRCFRVVDLRVSIFILFPYFFLSLNHVCSRGPNFNHTTHRFSLIFFLYYFLYQFELFSLSRWCFATHWQLTSPLSWEIYLCTLSDVTNAIASSIMMEMILGQSLWSRWPGIDFYMRLLYNMTNTQVTVVQKSGVWPSYGPSGIWKDEVRLLRAWGSPSFYHAGNTITIDAE